MMPKKKPIYEVVLEMNSNHYDIQEITDLELKEERAKLDVVYNYSGDLKVFTRNISKEHLTELYKTYYLQQIKHLELLEVYLYD